MKYIFRAISWVLCLGLRLTAWTSNRLHQWLKSGPRPRLWLATDDELMTEIRKRGLNVKKKKAKQPANVLQMTRITRFENYDDATMAVMTLQEVPKAKARVAVDRAVLEFQNNLKPDPQLQDVIQAALKYA